MSNEILCSSNSFIFGTMTFWMFLRWYSFSWTYFLQSILFSQIFKKIIFFKKTVVISMNAIFSISETPRCMIPEDRTLTRSRPASSVEVRKKPESNYSNDYPNIRLFSNLQGKRILLNYLNNLFQPLGVFWFQIQSNSFGNVSTQTKPLKSAWNPLKHFTINTGACYGFFMPSNSFRIVWSCTRAFSSIQPFFFFFILLTRAISNYSNPQKSSPTLR